MGRLRPEPALPEAPGLYGALPPLVGERQGDV